MRKRLIEILVGVIVAVLGAVVVSWLGLNGPPAIGQDAQSGDGAPPVDAAGPAGPGPTREDPPAARRTPGPGSRPVSRLIMDDGANTVTLARLEVTRSGRLKVHLTYQSHSTGPWTLTCPDPEPDLQSSHLRLHDGQRVYPVSTYCSAERPGQTFSLRPGQKLNSWGEFATVPPAGTFFALTWYNLGTVEGLKL